MKKIFTLLLLLSAATCLFAKDGYNVTVNITNNTDSLVFLCYYYGNGTTVQKQDSARLQQGNNTIKMSGKKEIKSGMYMLLFADKSPQVEFILLNGDDVNFSFDKANVVNSIKFINNAENTAFYDFKKYLQNEVNPIAEKIGEKLKKAKTNKDTLAINKEYEKLNVDIIAFRGKYALANPTTFTNALYKAMKEVEVPKGKHYLADGKTIDSTFDYWYYRNNFWNDFDFNDKRLIISPVYDERLDKYFKLIPMVPDSFNKAADMLMKKVKCGEDIYKFTFWWLARTAGMSKVMGMDESYVYMIEKYVLTADACDFLDSATKASYKADYEKMATALINRQGAEIKLQDANGTSQSLHNTCASSDFTVLVFYDPTCHHCEKEVPSLDSVLNILEKETGAKIMKYGVQNANEDEKWAKFIKDKKLSNHWVHVHDPNRTGRYRKDYNVQTNPVIYLLDKNAIIKGKRIDHSNIGGLIKYLWKKKKEGKN